MMSEDYNDEECEEYCKLVPKNMPISSIREMILIKNNGISR